MALHWQTYPHHYVIHAVGKHFASAESILLIKEIKADFMPAQLLSPGLVQPPLRWKWFNCLLLSLAGQTLTRGESGRRDYLLLSSWFDRKSVKRGIRNNGIAEQWSNFNWPEMKTLWTLPITATLPLSSEVPVHVGYEHFLKNQFSRKPILAECVRALLDPADFIVLWPTRKWKIKFAWHISFFVSAAKRKTEFRRALLSTENKNQTQTDAFLFPFSERNMKGIVNHAFLFPLSEESTKGIQNDGFLFPFSKRKHKGSCKSCNPYSFFSFPKKTQKGSSGWWISFSHKNKTGNWICLHPCSHALLHTYTHVKLLGVSKLHVLTGQCAKLLLYSGKFSRGPIFAVFANHEN